MRPTTVVTLRPLGRNIATFTPPARTASMAFANFGPYFSNSLTLSATCSLGSDIESRLKEVGERLLIAGIGEPGDSYSNSPELLVRDRRHFIEELGESSSYRLLVAHWGFVGLALGLGRKVGEDSYGGKGPE